MFQPKALQDRNQLRGHNPPEHQDHHRRGSDRLQAAEAAAVKAKGRLLQPEAKNQNHLTIKKQPEAGSKGIRRLTFVPSIRNYDEQSRLQA